MSDASKPKPAATVLLVRSVPSGGFEVFLTRRPDEMPFLGGMYCYPGGRVVEEDRSPRLLERSTGLTPAQARKIVGAQYSPREAMSFWIAAVREVFEEVGVLFAREQSGAPLVTNSGSHRLAEKHAALLSKSLSFVQLLESEGLVCDLASLGYFSHWQTPSHVPIRFATRFFIASLPNGQAPLSTSYEVAHSVWLTPDSAIQRFRHGELPMIFPTFAGLRTLADFETLDSVLREYGCE
jgi:8-oxo-dGTP pyrophosphatase MutT (NUDIX family)